MYVGFIIFLDVVFPSVHASVCLLLEVCVLLLELIDRSLPSSLFTWTKSGVFFRQTFSLSLSLSSCSSLFALQSSSVHSAEVSTRGGERGGGGREGRRQRRRKKRETHWLCEKDIDNKRTNKTCYESEVWIKEEGKLLLSTACSSMQRKKKITPTTATMRTFTPREARDR